MYIYVYTHIFVCMRVCIYQLENQRSFIIGVFRRLINPGLLDFKTNFL